MYFINFSTLENVIYISCDGEKKTLAQHERLQIVRTAEEGSQDKSESAEGGRGGIKSEHNFYTWSGGGRQWRWEEELEAAAVAILRRPRRFTASFITCEKATSRRE